MKYADLRDFLAQLERAGELRRVPIEVSPSLAAAVEATLVPAVAAG